MRPLLARELDRALVKRGGLHEFVRLAWHIVEPSTEFVDNWHIRAICRAAELCVQGDPDWARQIINVPPGHMKSLLLAVFLPAWIWTWNPGFCSIYASFDIDISRRDAGRTLQILQSTWYRTTWPEVILKFKSGRAAETLLENTRGGFRFATSVESKATGRHAHLRVVDDPIKPLDTTGTMSVTRTALTKCQTWWDSTMTTRTKDTADRWMVIMQRLHDDDLAGYLWDKATRRVILPAEYDPERPCELDQRRTEGELLWPRRFPGPAVAALRDSLGIYAPAQLDQRPTTPGGEVFKLEWLQHWTTYPTVGQRVLSVDCTFKDTTGSDYVCIQVWGCAGTSYYLLDQICERLGFSETLDAIKGMLARHPYIGAKLIEDKANGPAVIEVLTKQVNGVIPIMPIGGKVSRANAISHVFRARNVWLPPMSVPWVSAYRTELLGFPRAKHDDQVDATSQALVYLEANRSLLWDAMAVSRGGA